MAGKYGIDFKSVDKAFKQLASTKAGNDALAKLQAAHDAVASVVGKSLNSHEVHYLLSNLTAQRVGGHGPGLVGRRAAGVKIKHGFVIKTAVPAS